MIHQFILLLYLKQELNMEGQNAQWTMANGRIDACNATFARLPSGIYTIREDEMSGRVYFTDKSMPKQKVVNLPEMRASHILNLVNDFLSHEKDYKEGNEFVHGGAPYRAGVLIYGSPGAGKTCAIQLVTEEMIRRGDVAIFADCRPNHLALWLKKINTIEPNRKVIVIMEDLDALVSRYGETDYLNLLDSNTSAENVLFMATTNYPKRLDPRIYQRPGRFSQVVEIGLPSKNARRAFLKTILKNHRDVETIVAGTSGYTIDHLTALVNAVYREHKDLHAELDRLKDIFGHDKDTSAMADDYDSTSDEEDGFRSEDSENYCKLIK